MNYFAKINYLGTNFHGFQVQPGLRTVQGELSSALAETFSAPVKITGCSRTDAGVHAKEFCIKIECDEATVPADKLSIAASRYLPNDISIIHAEICSESFHPRYDAVSKEYLYRIINRRVYDPFEFGRAWFYPRELTEKHIEIMRDAARYIIGKKDFSSFMSEGSCAEDTVREVFYLDIQKNGDLIEVKICADGFLYNMVRIIVGTLLETAHGRFKPEDLKSIIESKDRTRAGMTAPPEGLYLNKVNY